MSGVRHEHLVIAMDGPAGSGKSSASRGVAVALGLRYLDTGAMYRAMAVHMLRRGIDMDDAAAIAAEAPHPTLVSGTDPTRPTITLDGEDVSADIRADAATAAVSRVSAVPELRRIVVDRQREEIGPGGIVVEGRDIGTVVAPDAPLKVFLVADPAARARRRALELADGNERDVARVEAALLARDQADSSRPTSPLARAEDAVVVNTTDLTLAEVIDQVVGLARQRSVAP